MAAQHAPGQQCDECEGFCLVPVVPLQTPVQAVEWVCHAATTIKDAAGTVLAECSGHGRHSVADEAIAAELVRRINAHDALLKELQHAAHWFDQLTPGDAERYRVAIAKAGVPMRDRSAYWRERSAKRRQDPAYREQQSAINKAWREQHGETPERRARRAEQMRAYRTDPILRARHEARWQLNRAIESGRVRPEPCAICGAAESEGHHVAYDMPLDVVWLCRPHHQQLHAEAKATGRAAIAHAQGEHQ